MSLLDQLKAALADGTIQAATKESMAKAAQRKATKAAQAPKTKAKAKPKKPRNPNTARKYVGAGPRLAGERHGFRTPPPPKNVGMHLDLREEYHGKLIMPVLAHYMPEELTLATYHPYAFLGCSPIWPNHLHL